MFSLSPTPISLISCPPKAKWWSLATGKLSPVSRASSVEVEGGGQREKMEKKEGRGKGKKGRKREDKQRREGKLVALLQSFFIPPFLPLSFQLTCFEVH